MSCSRDLPFQCERTKTYQEVICIHRTTQWPRWSLGFSSLNLVFFHLLKLFIHLSAHLCMHATIHLSIHYPFPELKEFETNTLSRYDVIIFGSGGWWWYVCFPVCFCVYMSTHVDIWKQRSASSVFLYYFLPFFFLKTGSLIELEAHCFGWSDYTVSSEDVSTSSNPAPRLQMYVMVPYFSIGARQAFELRSSGLRVKHFID